MNTTELIAQIDSLPFQEKIFVLEKIVKSIKQSEEQNILEKASSQLHSDYLNDSELTVFTNLDCEEFYAAR